MEYRVLQNDFLEIQSFAHYIMLKYDWTLLFNTFILTFFVKKLIKEILENFLTVFFLNVFKSWIHIHEAGNLIELT